MTVLGVLVSRPFSRVGLTKRAALGGQTGSTSPAAASGRGEEPRQFPDVVDGAYLQVEPLAWR